MKENIPRYALKVLDRLNTQGYHGYLVGGSLRDLLRGVPPHDFDMTTNARPEDVCRLFADYRVIPTGIAHGTVTVLSEGEPVEITTHRTDGSYSDGRHPDSVAFTGELTEDLSRRDFTVNAIAWNEEQGVIDPFGGQRDLQNHILRAVGEPKKRFAEDALRILRCFRFAAQLDFAVEEETAQGAAALREGLARVSAERIFSELEKLLQSTHPEKGLQGLAKAQCLPFVFGSCLPALSIAENLTALPPDAALRLAALLFEKTPEEATSLCKKLKTSNAFSATVSGSIAALKEKTPTDAYTARRFVCNRFPYFKEALLLKATVYGEEIQKPLALCETVFKDRTAVELRRLAVNGLELQQTAGIPKEKTAAALRYLQDLVWKNPTHNKKQELLAVAATWEENHDGKEM